MKKLLLSSFLLLIISFSILPLSACNKENYTQQEVIQETKNCLKEKYNLTNLYNTTELPTTYKFKNKYKSYIEWKSKNTEVVDTVNEKIYRTKENQTCILTATIYYKDIHDELDLSFNIPQNLYKNENLIFDTTEQVPIELYTLSYTEENGLEIEISILNNTNERKPLTSVYLSYSITNTENHALTNYIEKVSIKLKPTGIPYNSSRIYKLPTLSSDEIQNKLELTTNNFKINILMHSFGYSL